jgi:predicted transcriptional regulator
MRTTIEIPDEQRARLLEIAAIRGEKGFSGLVQEAIAQYLEREAGQAERIQSALATKGAIRGAAADQLQELTSSARAGWR